MSLRIAILGFLAVKPMSGYDLRKAFDQSVAHFWQADQAQIYRTLQMLLADDLVTVEELVQQTRPTRRLHHLTDAGRVVLHEWLRQSHTVEPMREAFLIQIFFGDQVDVQAVCAVLEARRADAEALCATLTAIAETIPQATDLGATLRYVTLTNGIVHAQAEIDWVDATLQRLADQDDGALA